EDQKQRLAPIVKDAVKDLAPLREKFHATRAQAIELFTQDRIDPVAIESLRTEKLRLADEASRRFSRALAEAAEVLTPEQRKTLAQRFERHRRGRRRRARAPRAPTLRRAGARSHASRYRRPRGVPAPARQVEHAGPHAHRARRADGPRGRPGNRRRRLSGQAVRAARAARAAARATAARPRARARERAAIRPTGNRSRCACGAARRLGKAADLAAV